MTTATIHRPHARRTAPHRAPSPRALANLAAKLALKGEYRAAEAAYRRALAIEPTAARWYGLAGAIRGSRRAGTLDRIDECAGACRAAIALDLEFAEAHGTLALLCSEQWQAGGPWELLDEGIGAAWLAYRLTECAEYLANYALLCQLAGQYDRALRAWDALVGAGIATADQRLFRSMIPLIKGDLVEGFREYQCVYEPGIDDSVYPHVRQRWDGTPTDGTIVIVASHGFGDCFQFLRYAELVRQRCGRVAVAALESSGHDHAASVFAGYPGVDAVFTDNRAVPEHDYWIPVLALPHVFGTALDTIPPPCRPALDPQVVNRWSLRAGIPGAPGPGFRVGVAWRGHTKNRNDPRRSFDPALLAPLASIPGVSLVALQIGRDDEIVGLPIAPIPGRENWMDTAAVISHLDLVITCETGIAHLAGTMGVPTWIALNHPPEWRWLLDREDSPWYPSVRLFRQRPRGDWPDVFARIEASLRTLASDSTLHLR